MGVTLTTPRPSHGGLNWDTAIEADLAAIRTAINTATNIDNASLNTITTSGIYTGVSLSNAPSATPTYQYFVTVVASAGGNVVQDAHNLTTGSSARRRYQTSTGTWSPWRHLVDDSSDDTGWVTSGTGMSAATSGWTLGASRYRIVNNVVSIQAVVTRATSALTVNAAGVLASASAVALPAALVPAQANGFIGSGGGASTASATGYVSASSAAIVLTGGAPGQTIAVGAILELMGTYLL
jgi:hypothetical protein